MTTDLPEVADKLVHTMLSIGKPRASPFRFQVRNQPKLRRVTMLYLVHLADFDVTFIVLDSVYKSGFILYRKIIQHHIGVM